MKQNFLPLTDYFVVDLISQRSFDHFKEDLFFDQNENSLGYQLGPLVAHPQLIHTDRGHQLGLGHLSILSLNVAYRHLIAEEMH